MANTKTTTISQPEPRGECLFRLSALPAELQLDIFRRAMSADLTVVSLTKGTMCISGELLCAGFQNVALTCRLAAKALEDIKRRNRRAPLEQSTPEDPEGGAHGPPRAAPAPRVHLFP
ncbi:hypothetical protein MAPG_05837 [Magnaporthiopsis poae ATCC 64411]|uniref:Uncharacterized protein n=1 Tax=Magnaporthiopsis poae (strain ATCC 64411 / 73-15) TaxID=644358 RepID=A0A0C4E0G3_MAGP6|nr:hypothetical protein MAPG_05837 [Magnaporthiopsis poae ATCC 64411]